MWIKKIHIDEFGKFSNYDLDMDASFTILYGHNEDGKSTLMAFIQMIFYGYAGMARDISQNPRKKYSPWNGREMKGYILFEDDGINYRIERQFGKSNATDVVVVWNLDTGEEVKMPARKDPGEVFFSMGSEAFERSVFIGQSGSIIQSKGKKDEITEKLLNMVTTGDEDTSYQKVVDLLKTNEEQLVSRSRKIGVMDKMEVALNQLGIEKYQAIDDEADKKAAQMKIETMKDHKEILEKTREEKEQVLELESLLIRKKALEKSLQRKEDFLATEKEMEDLKNSLHRDDMVLDEDYIAKIENSRIDLSSLEQKIDGIKERQLELKNQEEILLASPPTKVEAGELETAQQNQKLLEELDDKQVESIGKLEILGRYLGDEAIYENLQKEAKKTDNDLLKIEEELTEKEGILQNIITQFNEQSEEKKKIDNQLKELEKSHYEMEISLRSEKAEAQRTMIRNKERIAELEKEIIEAKVPKPYEVEQTSKGINLPLLLASIALMGIGVILGISFEVYFYALAVLGLGLFALSLKKTKTETILKSTVNEALVKTLEEKLALTKEDQQKEEDRLEESIRAFEKNLDELTTSTLLVKEKKEELALKVRDLETLKNEKRQDNDELKLTREKVSSRVENFTLQLQEKKYSLEAYRFKGNEETKKKLEDDLQRLIDEIKDIENENLKILQDNEAASLEELAKKKYDYDHYQEKKNGMDKEIETVQDTLKGLEQEYNTKEKDILEQISYFEPVSQVSSIPEMIKKLTGLRQNLQQVESTHRFKVRELSEEEKTLTLDDLHAQLKAVREKLESREMDVDGELDEEQFAKIKKDVTKLREDIYTLGNTITKEESTLKEKYREKKNVSQIDNEIMLLKTQLEGLREEYEALVLAREVLGESFTEIQRSFGPRLNESTAKIFSKLTKGKYQKLQVNRDFDIIVEDEKEQSLKEWKFLSGGTMDQAYLALRLSVATLLKADKDSLPLFLDDIFMQYDDSRAYEALSFLEEYQKEGTENQQIILFTCHQRILNWARQDFKEISLQNIMELHD